jgi:tetraacyldisaccharide 4'-kinase
VLNEAPGFWWAPSGWQAYGLWPLSKLYGFAAARRMRKAARIRAEAPVLCIGNFTVGGSGKTPTAIAFARQATARGLKPGILSRGHGGSLKTPRIVDAERDSADVVGDEPLLLASHATVAVSPDRAAAAKLLIGRGCDFLIMDDGLQSGRIHIDYALAIVDTRYGIGNGRVIPGGPLRAPLHEQMRHITALLTMGDGRAADPVVRMAARAGKPVFEASVRTSNSDSLRGRRFLAFAGIGHPDRFFDAVSATGGTVVDKRSFGDHHKFRSEELAELETTAHKGGLDMITTAKDAVRLRHGDVPPIFRSKLKVLEIEAVFDDPDVPSAIIDLTIAAYRTRRLTK